MPILDGYQTARQVTQHFPNIKIVMLSHMATTESIYKALQAGAHGYFSKQGNLKELETAIRTIQEKGHYFESSLVGHIHQAILWDKSHTLNKNDLTQLTEREINIIKLVSQGKSNHEIGDQLSINIQNSRIAQK